MNDEKISKFIDELKRFAKNLQEPQQYFSFDQSFDEGYDVGAMYAGEEIIRLLEDHGLIESDE